MAPSDERTPQSVHLNNTLVGSGYGFTSIALVVAIVLLIFNLATLWKP